ncbi:MAG: membrane protein insertase YidC [Actinomycetales bacterium]
MWNILKPIEWVVAWIMVQFHSLLSAVGMDPASGWTWALSIVGLVVVIRILLIPLFVKQIKASRGLQLIQPEMRKIQDKYKGKKDQASREAMSRETMDLYKRTGTNPFSSCMPILLQMPIFFALFRVLNYYVVQQQAIGPLTVELAKQADESMLLGAPLSATFMQAGAETSTRILTVVLIILMSASTFITQKQLMSQNMPASAMESNPFMQQQKVMLYLFPLIFAISGVNFPIGVLIYWLTTNLWSMAQQFFVIRRMPAPGSPAERAMQERRAKRGKPVPSSGVSMTKDGSAGQTDTAVAEPERKGQRSQPKRKDRQRRPQSGGGGGKPKPTESGGGSR